MEERVKQFQLVAEAMPTGEKLKKEISTLRRFLYRNQDYRFTDKDRTRLLMTLSLHNSNSESHKASEGSSDGEESLIYKLLSDALKMPQNVFSSNQKQSLLKIYSALHEKKGQESKPETIMCFQLADIDPTTGVLSLFQEDGSLLEGDSVVVQSHEVISQIQSAFDEGKEISVSVSLNSNGVINRRYAGWSIV